jgi:hypothetical protein
MDHKKPEGRKARFRGANLLAILAAAFLITSLFVPSSDTLAAVSLSITPITWNVVGLDSNNINVGPNNFPVGVRICNTGTSTATNVVSNFVWDNSATYINLRPGSLSTLGISSLAAGACTDFYYCSFRFYLALA